MNPIADKFAGWAFARPKRWKPFNTWRS